MTTFDNVDESRALVVTQDWMYPEYWISGPTDVLARLRDAVAHEGWICSALDELLDDLNVKASRVVTERLLTAAEDAAIPVVRKRRYHGGAVATL